MAPRAWQSGWVQKFQAIGEQDPREVNTVDPCSASLSSLAGFDPASKIYLTGAHWFRLKAKALASMGRLVDWVPAKKPTNKSKDADQFDIQAPSLEEADAILANGVAAPHGVEAGAGALAAA